MNAQSGGTAVVVLVGILLWLLKTKLSGELCCLPVDLISSSPKTTGLFTGSKITSSSPVICFTWATWTCFRSTFWILGWKPRDVYCGLFICKLIREGCHRQSLVMHISHLYPEFDFFLSVSVSLSFDAGISLSFSGWLQMANPPVSSPQNCKD